MIILCQYFLNNRITNIIITNHLQSIHKCCEDCEVFPIWTRTHETLSLRVVYFLFLDLYLLDIEILRWKQEILVNLC